MKYEVFIANYLRTLFTDDRDALFSTLQVWTGGLSTPRTASLLNMAAFCMDEGERYVEVGVFTGFTLISAGYDNRKIVLGIDNFDTEGLESSVGSTIMRDSIKERLKLNCQRFSHVAYKIIESDFRGVDLSEMKTGVAYIDGRHDYKSVTDNLAWLEPSLSKDAVIVFDDPDCEGVADAVIDWCHDHRDYELLYLSRSKDMFHRTAAYDGPFMNGLAIAHYKGKNGLH